MRQCPGCGFLVPPSWDECERCGADLADASVFRAASATAGTATAGTAVSRPASSPTTSPGPTGTRPPGIPGGADSSPGPATPAGPPGPGAGEHFDYFTGAPVSQPAPGSLAGVADPLDSDPPDVVVSTGKARRARALTRVVYVVCAVVLVAAGWYGYRQITAEDIDLDPAAQEWVDGERSVTVDNTLAGFRAELPASPEVVEQSMTVAGQTYTVHFEMSQVTPEYVVGVGYVDGPPGSEQELDALVADGEGVEFVAGGDTASIDTVEHQGRRAVDVVASVEGASTKVRMVPVGTRLYMAMIITPYESAPGFDRLVDGFELLEDPVGAS